MPRSSAPSLLSATGRLRARKWVARHRRSLAAVTAGLAVCCALLVVSPPASPTTRVWSAARELHAGQSLTADDLTQVDVPDQLAPAGALTGAEAPAGRVIASPTRQGEVLTDLRLVGAFWLAGYGDAVATPVRIADADAVRLLRPGDVVDVLASATDAAGGASESQRAGARIVAPRVRVMAVPGGEEISGGALGEGGLIVVASTSAQAAVLAQAEVVSRLSVTIRAG